MKTLTDAAHWDEVAKAQVNLSFRPPITRLYVTQERLDDACLGRVVEEEWNSVAQAWAAEQERLFLAPMIGEGI